MVISDGFYLITRLLPFTFLFISFRRSGLPKPPPVRLRIGDLFSPLLFAPLPTNLAFYFSSIFGTYRGLMYAFVVFSFPLSEVIEPSLRRSLGNPLSAFVTDMVCRFLPFPVVFFWFVFAHEKRAQFPGLRNLPFGLFFSRSFGAFILDQSRASSSRAPRLVLLP